MDSFPAPMEWLEAIGYPPVFLAALLGGLVTRRWFVAAALGLVLAPVADMVGLVALSDPEPHLHWRDSLTLGIVAGSVAVVVWGIARAVRARR